ncbi:hypothetical protein GCM10025771_01160 [Niveibacterium umoris]|uniref:DUF2782 domain-containing protein n=1 Tax=Niveibacterium umoris TaxID=1193620 RepID=A0A840BLA1_9RHOO|nr:DUF2782 domain-containing protein [Niveibacterium umoris]MBB4014341.1 hypothetical protein [Niveibacterium umoris]
MLKHLHRFLLIALLVSGSAMAEDAKPKLEPIPEPPPPPTGAVKADEAPEVTTKQREGEKIEEYRLRGKLYMIKVTPAVGKPYYLVDQKGDGVFSRADEDGRGMAVPMWLIMSW